MSVEILQTPLAELARHRMSSVRQSMQAMTERQAVTARSKLELIKPVLSEVESGASIRRAARLVFSRFEANLLPPQYAALARQAKGYSAASLERWARGFLGSGLPALADRYQGRQRKEYGWEHRATALYSQPTKPAYTTVAYWLREEGHESATNARVRRYLKSLPSSVTETAPSRVGKHFYNQNIRPHHRRDLTGLQVGEVYQGDGHRCDVYVQHPITGVHFRPEITFWIDMRSNYCAGWWLAEDESAVTTLYSLSAAIRQHGHVPVWVYTDPGSGFKNKTMNDEATGFYQRMGIVHRSAIPGNARGKGLVEGFNRWFEERCGKQFSSFCGHCRSDDALSRLETKIKRGEIEIPTWKEYVEAVETYIDGYNATPQPGSQILQGQAPNDVWEQLERIPLHLPDEALLRPQRRATVRRWEVRLFNRFYRAAELADHERRQVTVEYDLHDEQQVWIRDDQQRLVCTAHLVAKTPWASDSVIADARERSRKAKIARHERAITEIDARNRHILEAAAIADDRPAITTELVTALRADIESEPVIDEAAEAQARFGRALALEASEILGEEDARWLARYQTSTEYHARKALMDDDEEDTSWD